MINRINSLYGFAGFVTVTQLPGNDKPYKQFIRFRWFRYSHTILNCGCRGYRGLAPDGRGRSRVGQIQHNQDKRGLGIVGDGAAFPWFI
jgi:hypothetical protein